MAQVSVEIFRTEVVPVRQRLTYWNDVAVATFGDIAIDACSVDFAARMQRRRFGELTLARVSSTPARVQGGGSDRSRNTAQGWFLLLNERGYGRFMQRGREACLMPGQLTALRADEDYRIEFAKPNQTIVLHLPCEACNVDLEEHIAQCHGADETPLLSTFMRRLAAIDMIGGQEIESLSFARLVLDLATLTWPAKSAEATRKSMAHWRKRAFDVVTRRLDEPTLGAQSISRELQVSSRFVHMIFASAGHTVSAYILDHRLEHAARRLRADSTASITDVALHVGFSDLSHFCRRFRERFGVSASKYRHN